MAGNTIQLDGRRKFCKNMLSIGAAASAAVLISGCAFSETSQFASAFTDLSGRHFIGWFDHNGNMLGRVEIPERAHDLTYCGKNKTLFAFSRRPGNKLYVIDINAGAIKKQLLSSVGQHFYGHGVLTESGDFLYTTENRFDKSYQAYEGVIVVRNTTTYAIEAEFLSGGVGPHQLALMNQGNTIVVANGGIHTHPASPRTKLNIESMKPNISYLDTVSGKLMGSFSPPNNQLSTRHLCVSNDDKVYIGCQYQGAKHHIQPLIFSHKLSDESELEALNTELNTWRVFNQYTASLAIDPMNKRLAVTSPRGGVISYWDIQTDSLLEVTKQRDCAGIASSNGQFMGSTGRGDLILQDQRNVRLKKHQLKWDNHMIHMV
ncbi:DUF1513 domain-containing protein [Pseudoalteromonas sp. MMG005]|uniref:DUF1513 domain-containing protein n=1 Tax=Pseudoalteromonas sp. MMG005 TaxID=2822682 RepID=UPI001B3A455B|nr:DUF1513 domain-containing protein [Pseudoalteromonas sp. MMG005]MBQ4847255.1 DUF1513 domain-containing protein [Pseudoalteromonas sp. MMG005]